ncbi:2 3-bisphosphoglycerate-independent phosphoglycerate mutase, partial [Bienertia sinuspersici]
VCLVVHNLTPHGSTTSPIVAEEHYINVDDREPYISVEEQEEESDLMPMLLKILDLEEPKDMKTKCKHCGKVLSTLPSGVTSHLKRHIDNCFKKQII